LSHWSRSDDIRLSAQAICALANLDRNENEDEKYSQSIYLLHPSHRAHVTTKMDVVFLHGLLGSVFVTWRQRNIDKASESKAIGLLLRMIDGLRMTIFYNLGNLVIINQFFYIIFSYVYIYI